MSTSTGDEIVEYRFLGRVAVKHCSHSANWLHLVIHRPSQHRFGGQIFSL